MTVFLSRSGSNVHENQTQILGIPMNVLAAEKVFHGVFFRIIFSLTGDITAGLITLGKGMLPGAPCCSVILFDRVQLYMSADHEDSYV